MHTQIRGYCTLCRSRCGTLNTVGDDALLRVEPDTTHPTGKAMCMKGRAAPELVHSPHRVLYPMRRTTPKSDPDPGWQRISWEQALTEVAQKLASIRDQSGAHAVAFGVTTPSGTPLSDSIDWIERFIRSFGSPNIAYGTEVCNWHKDHAHAFTFGRGMPVADYQNADLVMLWGHNPTSTWLAQANAIAEGRRAGARLLVIDPRRTALAAQADVWLRVKPGTDAALALGLVNAVLGSGRYDHEFVRYWTNAPLLVRSDTGLFLRAADLELAQGTDPQAWVAWDQHSATPVPYQTAYHAKPQGADQFALRGQYTIWIKGRPVVCRTAFELLVQRADSYTPERVQAITGVPQKSLLDAAELISASSAVAYHAWAGVAQSANATQTERAIAILYALTGSYDRPGGNRVYAAPAVNAVNGLDLIPDAQRAKALGLADRPLGPPAMGWVTAHDMYQAILTGQPYRIRAFMGFGTNQLASQGDIDLALQAYEQLEFHVHCDLFETPAARYADIFLPVNTPWEREGLRIGFEINQQAQEHVQLRPRMVSPRGESRSDNDIVFDLACRLGMGDVFFDGKLEQAWNYQLAPLGLRVEQLRQQGSVQLALTQLDQKYMQPVSDAPQVPAGQVAVQGFSTQTARVELYSELLWRHGYQALPLHPEQLVYSASMTSHQYPLTMTSAKGGYYCHSQHRSLASLRKRSNVPQLFLHPELATEKGIQAGDWVRLSTPMGAARFVAVLDTHLQKEVISAEYGWWQSCTELGEPGYPIRGGLGSNYNSLVSARHGQDPVSGSVPMRHFACDVQLDPFSDTTQRYWTAWRDFQVQALHRVADEVLQIDLRPLDGAPLPDYRPGQHLRISVQTSAQDSLQRAYSLIGPAKDPERQCYQIAVRRQSGASASGTQWVGAMSGHLHAQLRVGSQVQLQAPSGNFVIPLYSEQAVVLMAGGIGITPFLSYLESLLGQPDMPEVYLHYANRHRQSHAFRERLDYLQQRLPRLSVFNYYSEPCLDEQTPPQYVDAQVVPDSLIQARARFYMCGPLPMMDHIRTGLIARGVPAFDIFSEVFRSPVTLEPDENACFSVRFMQSGKAPLSWTSQHGTLLEFAEQADLTLPSGCRVGQCESCAVTLLSGQVRHLHGVEPDDPSICLSCQAIPITDIVLDA